MARVYFDDSEGKTAYFEGTFEECQQFASNLRGNAKGIPSAPDTLSSPNIKKMPSAKQVREYIQSQPEMAHTIKGIGQHFMGRTVSPSSDDMEYYRLYGKIRRSQVSIAKKNKGKFKHRTKTEKNGEGTRLPYKEFYFVPNASL